MGHASCCSVRKWPLSPVVRHQFWDPWARLPDPRTWLHPPMVDTSPRVSWTLPTSELALALGSPGVSQPVALRPAPPTSGQQSLHKAKPGNQPERRPTKPTRPPTVSNLSQQKDPCNPTGGTLEHTALVIRWACTAGTHRTSTKGHFSKVGKGNQTTRYTEIKTAS